MLEPMSKIYAVEYRYVRADDEAGALALLEEDPFHQAGYINERIPREWNPVIGVLA